MSTDLYKTIGISKSSTQHEIKKAYRKQALLHHPDKGGDAEKFKNLTNAYEILKDPEKRNIYDKYGIEGLKNSPGVPEDIFSNLFNNFNPFENMFNMFSQHSSPQKSQPIIHNYDVDLEQLCQRKIVKLKYTRELLCKCYTQTKCSTCKGQGVRIIIRQIGPGMIQQTRQSCNDCKGSGILNSGCDECKNGFVQTENIVHLHLTPDMHNGYLYNFPKQGNQTNKSSEIGDFTVALKYKQHPIFKTDNRDIIMNQQITLKEALTGFVKSIKHPNGETININTTHTILNTTSNFLISEKGINEKGNFILNFTISFPVSLTQTQINNLQDIL